MRRILPAARWMLLLCIFSTARGANLDTQVELTVDGRDRAYFVHVPPQLDLGRLYPVILVFHGGLRDAESVIQFLGMDELADEKGFIAVYPEGLPLPYSPLPRHLFWNSSQSFFTSDANDVHFIQVLIDDLEFRLPVDPQRIFATGVSNGAHMAYRLACRLSDQIASVAPVAGSLETNPCEPVRPVPILDFHGTADQFLPFNGGGSLGFHSTPYTIQQWASIDGCPAGAQETEVAQSINDGTSVQIFTRGPCAQGSEVVSVVINGGGHNWPGVPLEDFPYLMGERVFGRLNWQVQRNTLGTVTGQISSKRMMWDFFQRHPMP